MLLATVQLDALVLLMLLVVARMAADARAGEIALAKLRGASSRQALLLATYELAVVNLVAFPLALAVGWFGASALARLQLRPGVPVALTLPALGVAAAVSVAALALLLLALGAAAAAVLATGGVMLHLYLYLDGRRRRFELAVLDALGARHRDLWLPFVLEHAVLVGWGVLAGGAVGLVIALVALPAVPQFLDPPRVPPVLHLPDWPVLTVGAGLALALVAAGLSLVVAGLVRAARPELLREEVL